MKKQFVPFCNYQFTNEGFPGLEGCCKIHFGEGAAYICPFSEAGIYFKQKGDKSLYKIKCNSGEKCDFFDITESAKKNLASNLD